MKKASLLAAIFIITLAVPIAAQDSTVTDTTDREADIIGLSFTFSDQDDVSVISAQAEMHYYVKSDWLSLGINIPVAKIVKFKEYSNDYRLTGDWLALGAVAIPGSLFFNIDSTLGNIWVYATAPIWLPVIHPRMTVDASRFLRLSIGWESAWSLYSYEDGVLFRPLAGIEIMPTPMIGFEAGVQHASFWSFERSSRSLGWGWYAQFKLHTPWVVD